MDIDHQSLVGFAKSWGLFYLIALAVGVLIYALLALEPEALRPGQEEHSRQGRQAGGLSDGPGEARSRHGTVDDRS